MSFVDSKLIDRMNRVEALCIRDRMEIAGQNFGEAAGLCFVERPGIHAVMAKGIPNPFFNQVWAGGDYTIAHLTEVLADVDAAGVQASIDFTPGAFGIEAARVSAARGYSHTGFNPVFLARNDEIETKRRDRMPEVREVKSAEDLSAFQDIYVEGWKLNEFMKKNIAKWTALPDWTLFLAFEREQPIGCAVLFSHDGVGYLADATTPERFRGRGAQKALLSARIEHALDRGCEHLMSRAEFGSISHENMEKVGLRMAYARAVWTRID